MKYFYFLTLFLITGTIIKENPEIQFSNIEKTYNKQNADKIEEKKGFISSKKILKNMEK